MTTPRVTPDQLVQIEQLLAQPAAGAVYGDLRSTDAIIRAHFRQACVMAGLPRSSTLAELAAAVEEGLQSVDRAAFPFVPTYLLLSQLAPGPEPIDSSVAGAGDSPLPPPSRPIPPAASGARQASFTDSDAELVGLIGFGVFMALLFAFCGWAGSKSTSTTSVSSASVTAAYTPLTTWEPPPWNPTPQPAHLPPGTGVPSYAGSQALRTEGVKAAARHLGETDKAVDRAMAARGYDHLGVADDDWRAYPAARKLGCYYHAAETHTSGTGERALALLSRDLASSRPEFLTNEVGALVTRSAPPDGSLGFAARPPDGGGQLQPDAAAVVRVLADVSGNAAGLEQRFTELGYTHPDIPARAWAEFSAAQKIECFHASAEAYAAGSGGRALALLSRRLAQQYESVGRDPAVRAQCERAVPGEVLRFAQLEPSSGDTTRPVPPHLTEVVIAMSEYIEGGRIGPTAALADQFNLGRYRAYELLRTSATVVEAMQRGLIELPNDAARQTGVDRLVESVTQHYEAARSDPAIQKYHIDVLVETGNREIERTRLAPLFPEAYRAGAIGEPGGAYRPPPVTRPPVHTPPRPPAYTPPHPATPPPVSRGR